MSATYPVPWLNSTFKSQHVAKQLLRPSLDAGTINEHDFNRAVQFLPGWHRYYDYAYALSWSFLTFSYGCHGPRLFSAQAPRLMMETPSLLFYTFFSSAQARNAQSTLDAVASSSSPSKPKIPLVRFTTHWRPAILGSLSVGTLVLGAVIGHLHILNSHLRFTLDLEDPKGFEKAIWDVYQRVGGVGMGKEFRINWIDPESPGKMSPSVTKR